MSDDVEVSPYQAAATLLAELARDAGLKNAVPGFVALTSTLLADGTEAVVPLGPPRASLIDAVLDGSGKGGVVAIVIRHGGKQDDGDLPKEDEKPNGPKPELRSPECTEKRDRALIH